MQPKKGNTKKPFPRKGKPKFQKKEEEVKFTGKESCANDPEWYIREGQLAKDVASFSFNNALGNVSSVNSDNIGGNGITGQSHVIPGIMRIATAPAVGYSDGPYSPVNLASKNLYSYVRHDNSGHANYDSPDQMLYIIAMDSIYAFIWHLQRAYGTARVYSQKNRYIGDALLSAMGFIPGEVRANLANFRAYINMLIVKASAFATPTTMSLFKRHTWMYSAVFKDEDVDKSQMYLYIPAFLYKYVESSGTPGFCKAVPVCAKDTPSNPYIELQSRTLSQWEYIGDQLIGALVASEDINIMSGDILKAYKDSIWKIALVPEDYTCQPQYSPEVLDQIHNTIFCGRYPRLIVDPTDATQVGTYDTTLLDITQDTTTNSIIHKPCFIYGMETSLMHYCDMEENEPSPEKVLVGTRNMVHGTSVLGANDVPVMYLDSYGSDICFFAESIQYAGSNIAYTAMYGDGTNYIDVFQLTKYNKAPLYYRFDWEPAGPYYGLAEVLGELGNYLLMNKNDIDRMHQSAILSMLGVPV